MSDPLFSLIPFPQSLELQPGSLQIPAEFGIFYHPIFLNEIKIFQKRFPEDQIPRTVYLKEEAHLFLHHQIESDLQPGGYQIDIDHQKIQLQSADKAGLFAGLQTILQLIRFATHNFEMGCTLPCLRINDFPRFVWRGFMLDEARHFQGIKTVLELLDWMAYLKMNIFHWHLSDDQGFRIAINQYPELTDIGSKRFATQKGGFLGKKITNEPHQGFYSQQEIRNIVAYAAERYITIVPEIDIPGHSSAILAAFPQLGCLGGPYSVQAHWGIHKDILCIGNPDTFPFLENLFSEVIGLFPGQYIHIGGDEVPKSRWKQCPKCLSLAKNLGLSQVDQLQTHLANHLNQFLLINSRSMLGWNETLADNLAKEMVVQYWMGSKKKLLNHVRNGRKTVLSNFSAYYLDHTYAHTSLPKVYRFEPVFAKLESEYHQQILGIEAPLWTEFVPSKARLDWQVFPRLLAVAESGWLDPQKKNYAHFRRRLKEFSSQLDQAGIGYASLSDAEPNIFQRMGGSLSLLQEGKRTRNR